MDFAVSIPFLFRCHGRFLITLEMALLHCKFINL